MQRKGLKGGVRGPPNYTGPALPPPPAPPRTSKPSCLNVFVLLCFRAFIQRAAMPGGGGNSTGGEGAEHTVKPLPRNDPICLVKSPEPPESQRYEKITKKIQIPPPRVGPQNYEKKKPKNTSFVGHFRIFCIFFVFLGPDSGWRDLYFFRIFGIQGVLGSLPGKWDRKTPPQKRFVTPLPPMIRFPPPFGDALSISL